MKRHLRGLARRLGLRPKYRHFHRIAPAVKGKHGLEIGGPTELFRRRNLFPVYPLAGSLESCNYSSETVWSGARPDYVHEATRLESIADERYDFLLASHVLEHVANPLKALAEWRRVVKPGGAILLLLPFREGTFDHRRPFTPLAHLQQDLAREVQEDDLTHLEEILMLHDLARDPLAGTAEQFRQRSLENAVNRCLHHHVFDPGYMGELFGLAGLKLELLSVEYGFHIVALGSRAG